MLIVMVTNGKSNNDKRGMILKLGKEFIKKAYVFQVWRQLITQL